MATIKEDINKSADWIAHALSSSGYRANFTPQSLWEIDRFSMKTVREVRPSRAACFRRI
jgi:hypothetical protein